MHLLITCKYCDNTCKYCGYSTHEYWANIWKIINSHKILFCFQETVRFATMQQLPVMFNWVPSQELLQRQEKATPKTLCAVDTEQKEPRPPAMIALWFQEPNWRELQVNWSYCSCQTMTVKQSWDRVAKESISSISSI